eukprot:s115_g30.t1
MLFKSIDFLPLPFVASWQGSDFTAPEDLLTRSKLKSDAMRLLSKSPFRPQHTAEDMLQASELLSKAIALEDARPTAGPATSRRHGYGWDWCSSDSFGALQHHLQTLDVNAWIHSNKEARWKGALKQLLTCARAKSLQKMKFREAERHLRVCSTHHFRRPTRVSASGNHCPSRQPLPT